MEETPSLVTTSSAARQLGVNRTTLARWAASGAVTPASRTIGGHLRWNVEQLRAQLEKLGATPP